jgi:hypothetical protein
VVLQGTQLHITGPRQRSHTQIPVTFKSNNFYRRLQDFLPALARHRWPSVNMSVDMLE